MVEKTTKINTAPQVKLDAREIAKKLQKTITVSGINNPALDAIVGDNSMRLASYSPKDSTFSTKPGAKGVIDSSNVINVFDEYAKLTGGKSLIADVLHVSNFKKPEHIGQTQMALATRARKLGLEKEAKEFNENINSQLKSSLSISDANIIEEFNKLIENVREKEKTGQKSAKQSHVPTFYIMPEPKKKTVDIDKDGTPDAIHDDIVAKFVTAQCPAAERRRTLKETPDVIIDTDTSDLNLDNLAVTSGLPLSFDNLSQYRKQVVKWLNLPQEEVKNPKQKVKIGSVLIKGDIANRYINLANNAKRTQVFIAGTNDSNTIGLESFLEGTTTVGAFPPISQTNNPSEANGWISNHDLVAKRTQGSFPIKVVRNAEGSPIGYNITEGNNVDVPIKETSSKGKSLLKKSDISETIGNINGESFSAPTMAGIKLREKFGDACDLL